MKSVEFTSWLKGFMDALEGTPSKKQLYTIRKKLNSVDVDRVPSIPAFNPEPSTFPNNPNPFTVTCDKLVSINGINQSDDQLSLYKDKKDITGNVHNQNSTLTDPYVGPYTIK